MYLILGLCLLVPLVHAEEALGMARQKRSNQYDQNQQQLQHQQLAPPTYQQHGNQQQHHKQETYQKQEHGYKQKKRCYQCAYSPPKTIHSKKAIHVGQQGHHSGGGPGVDKHQQHQQYSYVAQTLHGGWDKCLGPFDHYQAKAYGVDSWDCHSGNCYTRRDSNGDVFRGCFKGEYGVDQHRYGCHYQGGSTYCFCEGELCNSGAAPNVPQH